MRAITFTGVAAALYLYGFVFDLVADSLSGGIYCQWLFADYCAISEPLDYWLSWTTLLFVVPAACSVLFRWLASRPSVIRSATLFGILVIAS